MNKRSPYIAPMAVVAIIFGLILQIHFQACSPIGVSYRSKGLQDITKIGEFDSIGGMVGNGNGTGYGGKPRNYYSVDPETECTPEGSNEVTNIKGIIRVAGESNIKYFDGCEEKGAGQDVSPTELAYSSVNPDILVYQKIGVGGIFSFYESRPATVESYDWAVCHFYPMPIPMMGTDFYYSVIQAVVKYRSVDDSYTLGLNYEKITFVPMAKPLVEKGSVPFVNAGLDTDDDRVQYRPTEGLVSRLDVYEPVLSLPPEGVLRWNVGGMFREFRDGICRHRGF
ncbi:MAG: hypothetical protein H6624_14755 [Bdellovibrionaceae bacterium]|nr:hypothetical protein [Bdellovibrionales bacterium]MCB9085604.1 hypothetical protein [Pseudobdellovibrionaceae bacterium]